MSVGFVYRSVVIFPSLRMTRTSRNAMFVGDVVFSNLMCGLKLLHSS